MSSSFDSTKILNQHQSEQNEQHEQNERDWVLLSLDPPSLSTPHIPIIQDIRTSPTFQLSTTKTQSQAQTHTQKGWIKNTGTSPVWL